MGQFRFWCSGERKKAKKYAQSGSGNSDTTETEVKR